MQSIEEKIYEVFWDKNIARMINRADLFSFLKQYVNPGLLTRSSKSELVHDLKEYMTTANLEFIAERMESFGLPMVDTVSVLDTTSYAVKKLVDNGVCLFKAIRYAHFSEPGRQSVYSRLHETIVR